jgi:predicted RNA-binding Zn-ribbon protein involved in translation (DUF1610 family)
MKQSDRRRIYSFCLSCGMDIEDTFGYVDADDFNFCPACGSELVRMPREVVEWEYIEEHTEYCKNLVDILNEIKTKKYNFPNDIANKVGRCVSDVELEIEILRKICVVGTVFYPVPRTYVLTSLGEEILKRLS